MAYPRSNPLPSGRYERERSTYRSQLSADDSLHHRASRLEINDSSFRPSTSYTARHRNSSHAGHRHHSCAYQALCKEYILTLGWPHVYFNKEFDRCYCDQCYPKYRRDSYTVAGAPYVIPRGWVRFGLYVDEVKAKVEDIWHTWIVSYHGTSAEAAKSIVSHRQFLLSGDTREDGQQLGRRCEDLYTSPTIRYSGRDAYAKKAEFRSADGTRYTAKIVFQCRQKPGSYSTKGATGGARREGKLCDVIPNDRIELYTQIRSSVIPCGIMVRLTPIDA